jgi:YD repeat-containing protein
VSPTKCLTVCGAGTPLSSTRRWHVDKNGNVVQSIDGRGGLTTLVRDLFDRVTAIVDPAGNRTELLLSDRDEVLQRELFDPLSPSLAMARTLQEFDELGRLVKSIADPVSGGHPQSQTWLERDKSGLVTRRRSPRGEFTVFGHDGAGRLVSVTDPLGNQLLYDLDANGNPEVVTSLEQTSGGQESYALETVFDGQDRPAVRRRYAQGVPVGTGTPLVTSFGWDSRHQLATVTDPISRVLRTSYDLAGRPTSTVEDQGGLGLTTLYAHDQDDLLTGLTDPDGKVTGWIHDLLGRVREIDYALGGSELFTHDGEDAVKTHTRQDGVVTTLTYRADGALSSRTVAAQREELDWAAVGVPREARVLVSGLVRSRVCRTFDGSTPYSNSRASSCRSTPRCTDRRTSVATRSSCTQAISGPSSERSSGPSRPRSATSRSQTTRTR